MTIIEFVQRAVGTPFVERGRGYDGWDCWGLIVLAYRDVLGVALPSYTDDYTEKDVAGSASLGALVESHLPGWAKVDRPEPMDVALFRIAGRPVHVALVVDARRALHAEARVGTFIERLDAPMWARRLEGYYRRG